MRLKSEIESKLEQVESDDLLHKPPDRRFVGDHERGIHWKAWAGALRWVLGLGFFSSGVKFKAPNNASGGAVGVYVDGTYFRSMAKASEALGEGKQFVANKFQHCKSFKHKNHLVTKA